MDTMRVCGTPAKMGDIAYRGLHGGAGPQCVSMAVKGRCAGDAPKATWSMGAAQSARGSTRASSSALVG
jgi:hypothetical protein